ncbi:MAG: hypothetical protein C4519_00185 [Desulfobacteraceae bacterium]|nr:MAG: hypothetical protein C4519_00185 [Desulfobacteraceae bacterium]
MAFEYRSVPLNAVDEADTTFRISFGTSGRGIESSIRHVGVINAPVLLCKKDRYTIVSGFARIAACRQLGWQQIDARCLPADTPSLKTALLAIADNAAQRDLNIVELARSYGLIARHVSEQAEQVAWLHSLGLSVNKELMGMLGRILQMTARLQNGLVEGAIALPIALRLHAMQDAGAEELAKLFQEIRLGLNRQRELLDWIQAIAVREELTVSEILEQDPIAAWRRDETKDRGHVAQLIRQHLRKRRYPEITAFERHYAQCVKALKLPQRIQMTAPPHFEGRTYHLGLDFQDKQELMELNREIQRIISSPLLAELLSPAGPEKR